MQVAQVSSKILLLGTEISRIPVATCIVTLINVSTTEAKPFNTNINTNYNSNYNANLNANYLISSLLNYILDLLQIIHKNGQRSGPVDIPSFPHLHDITEVRQIQSPATVSQSSPSKSMDGNKEPAAVIKAVDEDRKAIEAAVDAFKGPDVPALVQPIPLDAWGLRLTVPESPEKQATKMKLLKSFAEAQVRTR
ncbi:hypothetical protein GHT06_019691 [Daphnia sinensis]|uniref:Uncharacterized protein n=1 Tax=Daphnia sinensis TaxID=1820382 RepID=A0AAD5KKG2_9CRUS|nr:hypothetical protein GHT06_019691 [Daphnia sinensis]